MKNREKNSPPPFNPDSKQMEDTENRTVSSSSRSEIDATHGEDAIEIEINEAERLTAIRTFAPMDEDNDEELEDFDDQPLSERKNRNLYIDPYSSGAQINASNAERPEGIQISRAFQAGVSFKDKDSYLDDEEINNKQKTNRADFWANSGEKQEEEEF